MNELPYSTTDTVDASLFEQSLPPGDYVVTFTLAEPSDYTVEQIRDVLVRSGIQLYSVTLKGNVLQVKYHKAEIVYVSQWQLIIPLIVPLITVGAVVFGILKINDITNAIIPLVLVVGGMAILVIVAAGRETVAAAIKRF